MHQGFVHIFWPSLHDCDMKILNFMHLLYGVGEHNTNSFFFLNSDTVPLDSIHKILPTFDKLNEIRSMKIEMVQI